MKPKIRVRSAAFIIVAASVFFIVALCLTTAVVPAAAQSAQITLLHIGDTHSHLDAWGSKDSNLDGTLGGLPTAATLVAAERASDPQALFVHAGDFMDGDVFFNEFEGVPELQLLKSMGMDALVLGNHEFRLGPDFLVGVLQSAWAGGGVPILGTNLDTSKYAALSPWITTTLIKEVHGVKVGFLGLMPKKGGTLAKPNPVQVPEYLPTIAPQAVQELRAQGAQVVVCLAHIGMTASRDLAEKAPGIDVIVNGHDNAVLTEPVAVAHEDGRKTLIVSAGNHYRWVGRLRLSISGYQVNFVDYTLLSADANTPSLPALRAAIDVLEDELVADYGDIYHQPLAEAGQDITAQWDPLKAKRDTPLGNLLTDAYRAQTGTDIAIEAIGFLGDPIPKGTVVGADIFRAMSYGNPLVPGGKPTPWPLVTFRTAGAALLGALDFTIMAGGDYFPQVSGMRFDYDSSADPTHQILRDTVRVGEDKIVPDQLYSVTATLGVFSALTKLPIGLPVQDVHYADSAFNAARSYVVFLGELAPAASNRIRDVSAIPRAGR